MRSMLLLAVTAALASCSTTAQQTAHDAKAQERLQQLLAGKVAGKPVSCLPSFRTGDMVRIDDDTVLFREGVNRIYRNELNGRCNGLGSGNYTLVTRTRSGELCRGDIAQMVDLSSGIHAGSCVIGDFVPYSRPRA